MIEPIDLIEAIEGNLFEAWEFLSTIPGAEYHKNPQMIRYIGGIPFPLCNSIMRANFASEKIDSQIEAAMAPIIARGLPMFWWIGPVTRPSGLGEHLTEKGLTPVEDIPGMAADLQALSWKESGLPGLTIRKVGEGDTLDAWMEVFRICFEVPEVAVDFFRKALEHAGFHDGVPYRHYIGFWKGEPVACSSVYLGRSAAGIYNVATLRPFRGLGIGAQMTLLLMGVAKERGFRTGVLHASAMGLPIYEKLGFKEYCRLAVYLYQP